MNKLIARFKSAEQSVSNVFRDASGALVSWMENGMFLSVDRSVAGKFLTLTLNSGAAKYAEVMSFDQNGSYLGSNGDSIPTVFSDELRRFSTNTKVVPGRVSGVVAYAGDTQALVRWSFLDATSTYVIKSGGAVVGTAGVGATSATITGLSNGTAYTFTVSALNSFGSGQDSIASNSVSPSVGPVAGLPPLSLWLDAAQLGLSNGANVTSFTDKSGNGWNGVNSGTGYTSFTAPTFLASWSNSKPAVAFSGNGQALSVSGLTADMIGQNASIIIVCDCTSLTNSGSQANQQLLTNQRYVAQPLWDDQSGLSVNTASGNFNAVSAGGLTGSSAITLSAKTILSIDLPGYLYVNGTKGTKRLSSLASTKKPIVLGSNTNGSTLAYTGRIAEVIVSPVQFTQAQRWAIEAYVAAKYGITVVQQ